MRSHTTRRSAVRTAARIAALAGLAAALGACASIPKRAWANGEAMSQSRAYRAAISGDNSFATHRMLESSLNPRLLNYTDHPYSPFPKGGAWW